MIKIRTTKKVGLVFTFSVLTYISLVSAQTKITILAGQPGAQTDAA